MKTKHNPDKVNYRRVPYETIKRAVAGDPQAIQRILEHFKPLILHYAYRHLRRGNKIDPMLMEELEADFVLKILKFRDFTT